MSDTHRADPLELLIEAHRATLDADIVRSGALGRVRDNVLARHSVDPLAGLQWQRIAAAVLIAGMLGGAVDLLMPDRSTETVDVAFSEALFVIDQPDSQ
jgi:ABC-type cobalamin transport system ATPase subunit